MKKKFLEIIKKYFLTIILFILVVSITIFFLVHKKYENKKINMVKTENILEKDGFDKFVQKNDEYKICIEETDKEKQEIIYGDMLWTIQTQDEKPIKTEKVDCGNGKIGIRIK